MKRTKKNNITLSLISILALVILIGVGIGIAPNQIRSPEIAAQSAQIENSTVPASFPKDDAPIRAGYPTDNATIPAILPPEVTAFAITGEPPALPTVEVSPRPTWDVNSEVYEPTATLTQKEEIIFDPVNGITITLQPGFHAKLPSLGIPSEMIIRNFDIGEDPRMQIPDNWITVFIGVGKVENQEGFEQFVITRHRGEVNSAKEQGTDFKLGEIQPFSLGQYQGYAYEASGTLEFPRRFTGTTFIKSQVILLPLDADNFAQANVMNVESPDYQKAMNLLKTIAFAHSSPKE